ncbi:hypothetical protein P5673_029041 [Acropora cervicornis]|uniref:Uncharacterized protein n=1 Tax=Acropora cervicornis TaxID=6130 RepID=A0AAD9PWX7_ACRCE|nr:hypothetical protein P5673_029041 [Acropora cervicornis]
MKLSRGGQAIAKRLCSQISKTTNAVKQLVKEYARSQTSVRSKYPSKVLVEDALDINSSMWLSIDKYIPLKTQKAVEFGLLIVV